MWLRHVVKMDRSIDITIANMVSIYLNEVGLMHVVMVCTDVKVYHWYCSF